MLNKLLMSLGVVPLVGLAMIGGEYFRPVEKIRNMIGGDY